MRCCGVIASVAWVRRVGAGAVRLDGSGGFPAAGTGGDALVAVGAWESAPPFGLRFVFATGQGMRDIYEA
jgi:hypothetical protein